MLVNRLRTARVVALAAVDQIKTPLQRAHATTTSLLELRVGWADCDLNLHMNNARYVQYMDTGRWDWMVRSGAWRMHRHAKSVIVEEKIAFLRELKPGQRFQLDTRLVGFRGKATVTEQHFLREGKVHAKAEVVSLLLKSRKVISAPQVRGMSDMLAPRLEL